MQTYTIRDVAQKAGVSVTTVSRVMNGRPDVNKATREKVLAVIRECNFVCNANAKNLKQMDAEFAAIIVRGRHNVFLNDVTERILEYGAAGGVNFLMEYIDEKEDEFLAARRLNAEKHATGFVLLGSRVDERCRAVDGLEASFVLTTVSDPNGMFPAASSVCIDDRGMSRRVTEYLLQGGHRRIAVFGGRRDSGDNLALRYLGVKDAFEADGASFDEALYVETRFSIRNAHQSAKEFFEKHGDVTAVFCMSDLVAVGVIRALKELGRRVPEDVSVVGFDGIEMGEFYIPSITTVRQPTDRIAGASVELLQAMMKGQEGSRHVRIQAEFLPRESSGEVGAGFS